MGSEPGFDFLEVEHFTARAGRHKGQPVGQQPRELAVADVQGGEQGGAGEHQPCGSLKTSAVAYSTNSLSGFSFGTTFQSPGPSLKL